MAKDCHWVEDELGNWDTDCGDCHVLIVGKPSENGMKFCCYCGRRLIEVAYVEE